MPVFTTNFSKSTELIIRYKANITLKIFFAQKRATEMILLLCLGFCKSLGFVKIYSDKAGKYRASQVIMTGLDVELSKSEQRNI